MSGSAAPLAGRGIVITRPAHQADPLAEKVRARGGRVILFPTMEIVAPQDLQPFFAVVDRLEAFDLAVFVSPNAVMRAFDLITAPRRLPVRLAIAAIGDATVSALERRGVREVIAPAHSFDSEALLALPAFHEVAGKRIAIFRGQGGRELLGETLAARGAQVQYAECYRRIVPALSPAPLHDAWAQRALDAFVATSSIGLGNLVGMVGEAGAANLRATPLFVPHPRIADNASRHGFSGVIVTGAGDEGIVEGLCDYFGRRTL
ncbi:MAG: uroporphyrinogen-III synthase [Betaproteobacteria bacterium]